MTLPRAWGRVVGLGLFGALMGLSPIAVAGPDEGSDKRPDATRPFALNVHGEIRGLRRSDVDGDGRKDLVLLDDTRTVRVWRSRQGDLPQADPTWTWKAPSEVAFVDVDRRKTPAGAALLALGTQGLARIDLATGTSTSVPGVDGLAWVDHDGCALAGLTDDEGALFLPTATGLEVRPAKGEAYAVPTVVHRRLTAAGPFLEDATVVEVSRYAGFVAKGPRADGAPATWVMEPRRLTAHEATRRTDFALPPPPSPGDRRLADLTGDGRPELLQRSGSNEQGRYQVLRAKLADGPQGTLERVAAISLGGFQLDPELLDLNGDGRLDLVVTTIPLHGPNLLRAMTSRRVTAYTNAFLNRGGNPLFPRDPDAVVPSEVGVRITFTYAGLIKVERSFTIVADADVNGDGRLDLVIRTSPSELTVRLGTADGVWAKEGQDHPMPPMGASPDASGYALDVDGDGRDEIVLVYRRPAGNAAKGKGRVVLWRMPR